MSVSIPVYDNTYNSKSIAFYQAGEVEEVWVLMKRVTEISKEKFVCLQDAVGGVFH